MEEAKEIKRYTLIKTRNSEYDRYLSNVKSLFIDTPLNGVTWHAQHERADVLEKKALNYARALGIDINYTLRTGTGIVVEFGHTTHKTIIKGA